MKKMQLNSQLYAHSAKTSVGIKIAKHYLAFADVATWQVLPAVDSGAIWPTRASRHRFVRAPRPCKRARGTGATHRLMRGELTVCRTLLSPLSPVAPSPQQHCSCTVAAPRRPPHSTAVCSSGRASTPRGTSSRLGNGRASRGGGSRVTSTHPANPRGPRGLLTLILVLQSPPRGAAPEPEERRPAAFQVPAAFNNPLVVSN